MDKRVKKLADTLLQNWIDTETGVGLFRFTGAYWEILYPILKKYSPHKLSEYEALLSESFDYFYPQIKKLLTTGIELRDIKRAIRYSNTRIEVATAYEVHLIEIANDELIPYVPNQNMDIADYFGRE